MSTLLKLVTFGDDACLYLLVFFLFEKISCLYPKYKSYAFSYLFLLIGTITVLIHASVLMLRFLNCWIALSSIIFAVC